MEGRLSDQASGAEGYRRAVGIMLLNAQGQVLVARRADLTARPAWQMPQGGIDPGETPRQAAMRELAEEIGTGKAEIVAESRDWLTYDLPAAMAATLWGGRYRGQCQKWFMMRFTGHDAEIDLAGEHAEFDAWRWVALDELPELIVSFKRQLYLDIVTEFRERCRELGVA
ncbi:MAG TPA: RNA pyrophosphohydrolase [Stellaceae bacterium]|nr:RNA pyrophosphohydrolase [Stellaceae bacterium]